MATQAERGTRPSASPLVELAPLTLGEWVDPFTAVQARANGFSPSEKSARRHLIASHADDAGIRSVGAFSADRLVGFAFGAPFNTRWSWAVRMADALAADRLWAVYGPPFWLLEIHVVPGLWRQKIGTRLLSELLSTAADQWVGLTRHATAQRAHRFYERAGFCDLPAVPAPPGYVVMGGPPVVQRLPDTFRGAGNRAGGTVDPRLPAFARRVGWRPEGAPAIEATQRRA